MVTAEPDSAPRHHLQRFDEVRHKAEMFIHPLTMPAGFVATLSPPAPRSRLAEIAAAAC